MNSAIITGATGFVGVHLTAELITHGIDVTALCRSNSMNLQRLNRSVRIVYNYNELPQADVFYHLAWEGASGPGRGDASLQARNAEMTLTALTTANKLGCGKFVALGTIYEKLAPQIKAGHAFSGSAFYILSKDYARAMAEQLAYKLKIPFVWCTVCHPIGRLIKPEQMMAYVVSSLLSGVKPAFGPAQTLYDIVAAEDLARGLYLAGYHALRSKEYYIGSGAPKPLKDWLMETKRILAVDTPIGIGERPDDGLIFEEDWFDITPLAEETGYKPRVSFAEAVKNIDKRLI